MENPSLLEQLRLPGDIKDLSLDQLNELCDEIRNKIINTVSKNGGHLASNLGVVELTVLSITFLICLRIKSSGTWVINAIRIKF